MELKQELKDKNEQKKILEGELKEFKIALKKLT